MSCGWEGLLLSSLLYTCARDDEALGVGPSRYILYRDADCIEANSQFSFFRKEEEIYKEAESGWVRVESDSIRNQ